MSTGVVTKQYERVKLHVTLMNTRHRHDNDGVTDSKDGKDRESFCARQILEVCIALLKAFVGILCHLVHLV